MAISIVEIANSALVKIGAANILSLDDDSREARLCKLRYNPVRKIVLRMHPWGCAIDRASLAPLAETPVSDFTHAFQLPSSCLRVLDVGSDVFYRIEGRRILANATELQLQFIRDEEDVMKLDELLAEAIACYLAWDVAYALTQSNKARETAWSQFETIRRQAMSVNAQEERDHTLTAELFVEARTQGPRTLRNPDTLTS